MKSSLNLSLFRSSIFLILTIHLICFGCADNQLDLESLSSTQTENLATTTAGSSGLLDCAECTYVVPEDKTIIDGALLDIQPGSVIGLNGNFNYGNLVFKNIIGTPENPVIIKNCNGTAILDATGKANGIKTERSKHFRITGGDIEQSYGIKIVAGHMGMSLGYLSTDFEIDHVEIMNSGFAGIMAKTDPSCDDATIRGNFLMENVDIHHNYIHDTGGEGIYAGHSWFMGMTLDCGLRLPHEIHNISIFSNQLKNTGWEAIQLGCATKGASIHGNTIENYGLANKATQNNGIQISTGTGGLCYNNLIRKGTGNGMIIFGLGDNIIFNNIIDQPGNMGIFCDERETPGQGFVFLNNTILNPKSDGIRIFAELVPMNVMINNLIVNPGSYANYLTPDTAFVSLLEGVRIHMSNNHFTTDMASLNLADPDQLNYRLELNSPLIDKGTDVSEYHPIATDYYGVTRQVGTSPDIGAVEFTAGAQPEPVPANVLPVVNAGTDKTLILPDNSIYLQGNAADGDGTIVSYQWSKVAGGAATLSGQESSGLQVSDLEAGVYTFRFTATDDHGDSEYDDVNVTVSSENNVPPVAKAGPNLILALPTTSTKIYGSGIDSDGTIESYQWTQYGGTPVVIENATSATATISGLVEGKFYFTLTVKDNDGATHSDNVLIKVEANLAPVANAGPNQSITLPENSITIYGSGTDPDGAIVSYVWKQYGGPAAYIQNALSPALTVSGLTAGKYYFRLTVTDDDGATHYDNMLLKVEEPTYGTGDGQVVLREATPQAQ